MAKTEALISACISFGKLFGSDLNKADDIAYTFDLTLIDLDELHPNWEKVVKAVESGNFTIEQIKQRYNMSEEIEEKLLSLQKK